MFSTQLVIDWIVGFGIGSGVPKLHPVLVQSGAVVLASGAVEVGPIVQLEVGQWTANRLVEPSGTAPSGMREAPAPMLRPPQVRLLITALVASSVMPQTPPGALVENSRNAPPAVAVVEVVVDVVVLVVEVVLLVVVEVVVLVVVEVVVLVVVEVVVLVVVEVVVLVVVEVVVLVVVEVVVLVVVEVVVEVVVVVIATAIVLSMLNGLLNPSSRVPLPVTAAVAVPGPPRSGIVHGNGPHESPGPGQSPTWNRQTTPLTLQTPNTTVLSCAGTLTLVTRLIQRGEGGTAGSPVGPGQQKSAVTLLVLHPTWHPADPGTHPGGCRVRSTAVTR